MSQALFAIEVSALPMEMPAQVDVDVSVMTSEDSVIRAGDIQLPSGATLVTDPEEMVARIDTPRGTVGEEGAEAQGGEAEAEAGD